MLEQTELNVEINSTGPAEGGADSIQGTEGAAIQAFKNSDVVEGEVIREYVTDNEKACHILGRSTLSSTGQ